MGATIGTDAGAGAAVWTNAGAAVTIGTDAGAAVAFGTDAGAGAAPLPLMETVAGARVFKLSSRSAMSWLRSSMSE